MFRFVIIILLIAFPVNAMAAALRCSELKVTSQVERPCHGSQGYDVKKEAEHNCKNCAFCYVGAFLSFPSSQNYLLYPSDNEVNYFSFAINNIKYQLFKPPKIFA